MKNIMRFLVLTIVFGLLIVGCSEEQSSITKPELSAKEMADHMIEKVEQPSLMELEPDQIKDLYKLDPEKLEEYSIRIPMMNVKTNEIAILKVKDAKDLPDLESALKQRAEDVQKQFETYLPDQYENAKNYKIVKKGNYVLFVISEESEQLLKVYDSFFEQK